VAEANRLRAGLPIDVQNTLSRHEAAGTTADPAYAEASMVFNRRHVCRLDPWPDCFTRSFRQMEADPEVYHTMNGPSEFHVIGSLRDWSIVDRVSVIDVPTLLISGRYDEATPETVQPFHDGIPDVRWEMFDESSHMPHVEETERFIATVDGFLDMIDKKEGA
jgi:L-proline amide hydrolase